ncbi:hypothetical protein F7725_012213 [Dissostichus mawsoni]|uniref:Uncharacterized protein n=1 Tax=Dissostichus mawsoni TaxID=36200 RepID=A0A7J5YNC3_DISMA|nr:hypothetical protein F7725_012213 [Dissostichus mawsoni]
MKPDGCHKCRRQKVFQFDKITGRRINKTKPTTSSEFSYRREKRKLQHCCFNLRTLNPLKITPGAPCCSDSEGKGSFTVLDSSFSPPPVKTIDDSDKVEIYKYLQKRGKRPDRGSKGALR